jgi:ABC-type phosphate transport system permease subunit
MWGLTTVVGAFALALIVMSFAFMGGAVIVAVPLALLAVGIAAFVDFNRRRKTAQSIHAHRPDSDREAEFTDRDQRTLVSE